MSRTEFQVNEGTEMNCGPRSPEQIKTRKQEQDLAWQYHPKNPFNWRATRKWLIFLTICLVIVLVGLNNTVIATPGVIIAEEFGVDGNNPYIDNTVWPITAWNTGAALGPMVGIPFLESFGVRKGLIIYALFFLCTIPQAVAPNFATMVAFRALAGFFGGILLNWPECILADVWLTDPERDLPVTLFVMFYLTGITLGPTFGALMNVMSWRWIFWIQVIIYGALFIPLLLIIKETRGPVIRKRLLKASLTPSSSKSKISIRSKISQESGLSSQGSSISPTAPPLSSLLYTALIRPFHMLVTEPVVAAFALWSSLCFGIVYTCIQSITQIYQTNYNFTDAQCGLIQLSLLAGLFIGVLPCIYQNAYYQRCTQRNNGIPIPERRLPVSVVASLVGIAGGLFWYAWASYPHVHWILPTIGIAFIGFGVQVVVTAAAQYVTDAYTLYAGSAISCFAFGENVFAAWLPLASRRMYDVLGFQWASTVLAFAALVLTAAPVVLLIWGEKIRGRSHFIQEAKYSG